jgi:pimeloyl-ACP methyl ester carboxylesterase
MKKKIKLGNLELNYLENRNDGMPVVFIHGNSLDADLFGEQFADPGLENYHLIAIDLPGHGSSRRSENPEKDYSVGRYIYILNEFLQEKKIQEAIFVGHSLGGHLCIHLSEIFPHVKGMLITGTPPLKFPPNIQEAFLPNPAIGNGFKPDLTPGELHALTELYLMESSPVFDRVKATIETTDPLVRPFIGKSIGTDINNSEVEMLKSSDYPLAIFHGKHESVANLEYIQNQNFNLWRNGVQIIPGSNHLPFLENPSAFNKLLANFLDDIFKK